MRASIRERYYAPSEERRTEPLSYAPLQPASSHLHAACEVKPFFKGTVPAQRGSIPGPCPKVAAGAEAAVAALHKCRGTGSAKRNSQVTNDPTRVVPATTSCIASLPVRTRLERFRQRAGQFNEGLGGPSRAFGLSMWQHRLVDRVGNCGNALICERRQGNCNREQFDARGRAR